MKAELCFLGTGTSQGVPIIGCKCAVCTSSSAKNKRLRSSASILTNGKRLIIDAGPDFRQQMLRENISEVSAILITHPHRDHIGGLDDIRPFNYYTGKNMPIYGSSLTIAEIKNNYPYAFAKDPYPGVPQFEVHEIEAGEKFKVEDIEILPLEVMHYKMPITAFRIGSLVYITDANFIADKQLDKIKGCKTLVVNALRYTNHMSHFNVTEALELVDKLKPQRAFFTHISHEIEHDELLQNLPQGVEPAYDGLKIDFEI